MNKKIMSVFGGCLLSVLLGSPAQGALLTGTLLTIDQGSGDCSWSNALQSYNCSNLAGSYVMGGWSNGPASFYPSIVGFLNDGHDDATGDFVGGPTAGTGLIIGVSQPYEGIPIESGMPYDPATGQNITTAFETFSGSSSSAAGWGTFYSTSPIVDNDNGTLDFAGFNMAWLESPALFGSGGNLYPPGDAIITLLPGVGAFGAGRYALDYFSENCIPGNFECNGFLLHLEGSISPVPLPAAAWLFGSGLVGLIGVVRRRRFG